TLASITTANLTSSSTSSPRVIDTTGFAGQVTLSAGGAGDKLIAGGGGTLNSGAGIDRYVFQDGFGIVTINNPQPTDILDFVAVTTALTVQSDFSIHSGSTNSITQIGGRAHQVNFSLGTGTSLTDTIKSSVSDLSTYSAKLKNNLTELNNVLPLLNSGVSSDLARLL